MGKKNSRVLKGSELGVLATLACVLIILSVSIITSLGFPKITQIPKKPITSPTISSAFPTPSFSTFDDKEMGISFSYPYGGKITKEGNKVQVIYPYILLEVFPKSPDDTLEQAIKTQFLKNYANNCVIVNSSPVSQPQKYPSYEHAYIRVNPAAPGGGYKQFPDKHLCPFPYTREGGIAYFKANPDQPNKFVFIQYGQMGLGSGEGIYGWDATIKIY